MLHPRVGAVWEIGNQMFGGCGEGKIKPLRPKKWTESELHRLRALAKKEVTADIVAELLDRHVGSVKRKAREIGLILSKNMKSSQAGPLRPK
jgi:hypothetical protein